MNFKAILGVLAIAYGVSAASTCDTTDAAVQNIAAGLAQITHLMENVQQAFEVNKVNPEAIRASLGPLEQASHSLEQLMGSTCMTANQINQITASSVNLMNEVTNLGFSAIRVLREAADNDDVDEMRLVVREIMFSVRTLVRALSAATDNQNPEFKVVLNSVESLASVL